MELAYGMAEAGLPVLEISYSGCPPAIGFERRTRPDCKAHNQLVLDYLTSTSDITTVVITAHFLAPEYRENADVFWSGFDQAWSSLFAAGKTVVILDQVPAEGRDIPTLAARGLIDEFPLGASLPQIQSLPDEITVISLSDLLCHDQTCPILVDNMPLLFDDDHLSMTAARHIAPEVVSQIRAAMQQ